MTESPVSAEYYISVIREQIARLVKDGYSGNIEFKVHFMSGNIAHMNETSNKSYKFSLK